jgi:hypothetical protein
MAARKKVAKKKTARRKAAKRELIDTGANKLYVRRSSDSSQIESVTGLAEPQRAIRRNQPSTADISNGTGTALRSRALSVEGRDDNRDRGAACRLGATRCWDWRFADRPVMGTSNDYGSRQHHGGQVLPHAR